MKVKKKNMAASISGPLRSYLRKSLNFSNLLCKFRRLYSSDFSIDKLSSNSETFSGDENLKSKDPRVQKLLKRLIARNVDLDKVFKARKEPLNLPTYQLLTDEEVVQVCCCFVYNAFTFNSTDSEVCVTRAPRGL